MYLAELTSASLLFVTQVSADRALPDGGKLFGAMDAVTTQLVRVVAVSRRLGSPSARQRMASPPRNRRMAKLEVGACRIEIKRPYRAPARLEDSLSLNYVLVRESWCAR